MIRLESLVYLLTTTWLIYVQMALFTFPILTIVTDWIVLSVLGHGLLFLWLFLGFKTIAFSTTDSSKPAVNTLRTP